MPPQVDNVPVLISQQQRIDLIRRVHRGDGMQLNDRILVLLFARPLIRVQHLTIDDLITGDTSQLLIRLGEPARPILPLFDDLIRGYLTGRTNLTAATNPDSRWLFAGRRAGQPLQINSMRLRLTAIGIPNLPGRSRASLLNCRRSSAESMAREGGTTWAHYAAGTHHRTATWPSS